MTSTLRRIGANLKNEIALYQAVAKDPRVPRLSKALLGLALFYLLLPFDLIPDFIPVIGHLDDVVIIPALIYIALKLIPPEVIADARQRTAQQKKPPTSN